MPARAAESGGNITDASSLEFATMSPRFGFDAYHVQGLCATDKYFFLTAVDKPAMAAWIFKIDRSTMNLAGKENIAKTFDFHPGGSDFDGKYIWVPVAVYTENSHTFINIVDPKTLRHKIAFEVKDHIGALARDGDLLIGANWDSVDFYFWTLDGQLIEKRPSPTGIGYQDCKGLGGRMACVGNQYLDIINLKGWKLEKRFTVAKSEAGSPLSREGLAILGDSVFFLPDDGPDGRVYEYKLVK